jgi:hypothetical protein
MWLFLPFGFLSVVAHQPASRPSGKLLVRARRRDHLERFVELASPDKRPKIECTPERDYPYRVLLGPADVQRGVIAAIAGITYPNFKNRAHRLDEEGSYTRALHAVWSTMLTIEDPEARPARDRAV